VTPLPAIDVTSVAALQPLDDAWNWAHTQVAGDGGLAATAASQPGSVISRLLCPRRLDPETAYTAFLVSAFDIGRLAGLGLDVSATHTSDPAWTSATGAPLRLPVYYQFSFHTSDQGDFESLVRRLTPRKLGAEIGEREMAVDAPMPDIPSAGPPLMLPGALQSIVATTSEWDDPAKTQFQTAVADLVNRVAPLVDNPADPDPQVVPPMYGRWPAGVDAVAPGATGWLDELSLDPRNRTMGGMGTLVVQANQTPLMASAWQQVAGIEAANAALRDLVAAATLGEDEYRRMTIPTWNRTLAEFTAPFQSGELDGTLELRRSTLRSLPDPYLEAYKRDGDLDAYVASVADFFRAAFEESLMASLDPQRDPASRESVAAAFRAALRRRIAAAPEAAASTWHVAVLDIARS